MFGLFALIASCGLVLAVRSIVRASIPTLSFRHPGQIERDAHYAAALWLMASDPGAALAVLRVSHDTLPPVEQCEAPISSVKRTAEAA